MSRNLAVKENIMSEAEYLAFEEKSKIKHEFMDGEIFAMAGATQKHNLATNNIARVLGNQLEERDCEVYSSDFRVRVRNGHSVYPDVAVACEKILTEDDDKTLLNPIVVFEVLSKSTEKRDRGDKAEDYFRLSSLKEYILVSQYYVRVEHYSKQKNNKWILEILEDLQETLELKSVNCQISLKLIYLKMKLSPLKLVEKNRRDGK